MVVAARAESAQAIVATVELGQPQAGRMDVRIGPGLHMQWGPGLARRLAADMIGKPFASESDRVTTVETLRGFSIGSNGAPEVLP